MHRECPPEFQGRIDQTFGSNPYGEPIFKLVWGQTATMRAGGQWANGFRGYRDILMAGNAPCWVILMWEPASVYGSEGTWYYTNRDENTGLQDLGEYPYHGRYRVIHKLMTWEVIDGKPTPVHLELSTLLVNGILPLVKAWQSLSKEKQVLALQVDQQLRDDEIARAAIEAKKSFRPAFSGRPVSFTKQGCRTSLIARKEEFLEKNWRMLMSAAARYKRGFHQVN